MVKLLICPDIKQISTQHLARSVSFWAMLAIKKTLAFHPERVSKSAHA